MLFDISYSHCALRFMHYNFAFRLDHMLADDRATSVKFQQSDNENKWTHTHLHSSIRMHLNRLLIRMHDMRTSTSTCCTERGAKSTIDSTWNEEKWSRKQNRDCWIKIMRTSYQMVPQSVPSKRFYAFTEKKEKKTSMFWLPQLNKAFSSKFSLKNDPQLPINTAKIPISKNNDTLAIYIALDSFARAISEIKPIYCVQFRIGQLLMVFTYWCFRSIYQFVAIFFFYLLALFMPSFCMSTIALG